MGNQIKLYILILSIGASVNLLGQYFSHHHNFADKVDLDYGAQLLVSNDTIYLRGKRYKNDQLVATIYMLDIEGNILHRRDIDWAWALTDPYSLYKDGSRLLYYQSDDQDLNTQNQNGLELLVMDSANLDSLSYHYYDSGYPTFYMYANAITKLDNQYILSASTKRALQDNELRFFSINADDMRLDSVTTIHQDTFWANAIVSTMVARDGKLLFGYSDATGPRPASGAWSTGHNHLGEIDREGNFKRIGTDYSRTNFKNFLFMENGNILISGDAGFFWPSLHMVDKEGEEVWTLTDVEDFVVNENSTSAKVNEFIETEDGHILICGNLNLLLNDDGGPSSERYRVRVGSLIKVDKSTGDIIWDRALFDLNDNGAPMGFELFDVKELSDGSFIATGISYPNREVHDDFGFITTREDPSDIDTWIIRVSPEGCILSENCDGWAAYTSSAEELYVTPQPGEIVPYPNPVSEILQFDNLPSATGGILIIRNMEGRIVQVIPNDSNHLSTGVKNYVPGQYILEYHYLDLRKRAIAYGKFMKVE